MTARRFVCATLVLAAMLAGCVHGGQPSASPLTATDWLLVSADGATVPEGLEDPRPPYLRLEPGGRALGFSAVNSFSGTYEARGSRLTLGPLAVTRRAGPPAAMAIESAMLQALQGTASYRIAGDTLELLDGGGRVHARFVAKPAQ
jgi:heat shock protein HslJ